MVMTRLVMTRLVMTRLVMTRLVMTRLVMTRLVMTRLAIDFTRRQCPVHALLLVVAAQGPAACRGPAACSVASMCPVPAESGSAVGGRARDWAAVRETGRLQCRSTAPGSVQAETGRTDMWRLVPILIDMAYAVPRARAN